MVLTDVKYWFIKNGIGHIIVEAHGMIKWSISHTACGLFLHGWPTKQYPSRICCQCKQELKNFILTNE